MLPSSFFTFYNRETAKWLFPNKIKGGRKNELTKI